MGRYFKALDVKLFLSLRQTPTTMKRLKVPLFMSCVAFFICLLFYILFAQNHNKNFTSKIEATQSKYRFDDLQAQKGILDYSIEQNHIRLVGDFDLMASNARRPTETVKQALSNVFLINILRKSYCILALEVIPNDYADVAKLCIDMRKRDENQH